MSGSLVTDLDSRRRTAAEQRAIPNMPEIAQDLADQHGVCTRPLPMRSFDQASGEMKYVGAPCKSTLECVCPACAARARALRIQQCREGWHIEEEPVDDKREPTEAERAIVLARASLQEEYEQAKEAGDQDVMDGIREVVADLDAELRESGVRGPFPPLDPESKSVRKRSTRRRQESPDLPRQKVSRSTVGREYAGKYRPSMFLTLTLPSYGKVGPDGAPIDPDSYDYRQAARDIIHFPALFDRFVQNYRRASGRDVQYFATVEPQRRGAPHIHAGVRGSDPRAMIRQLTAATYHQVHWPHFDQDVYTPDRMPVWNYTMAAWVDPDEVDPETGDPVPVPTWDQVMDLMDEMDDIEPAHVVRFGQQVDVKGILGGTEEAGRHIGYLTKYLTKSISEVIEPQSDRAARHYDRLHEELCKTPCSPRCGIWLRYGVVPKGANEKTVPGRCKGKAHRRDTLGLRGRRVLVSRKWTGKNLTDHKADRVEFVRQRLAEAGISKEDVSRFRIAPAEPGDPDVPPREYLIMSMVAEKIRQRSQYDIARLAQAEQDHDSRETVAGQQDSANPDAA
ncbi:replication initiator [Nocardia jiangxiensis]|uniref:replication initiator n=1 Tax=Nocardia jiangxiensis TaxID=282685 RepID=UPI00031FD1D3|nr:replication initiator [Nocardia jiangxiensis]